MSAPATTIETVKTAKATTGTTAASGTTVVAQSMTEVTQIEVSGAKSDGSAGVSITTQTIVDESEEFYEEIEDDDEDEDSDGRGGSNQGTKGGITVGPKGKPYTRPVK